MVLLIEAHFTDEHPIRQGGKKEKRREKAFEEEEKE